MEAWSKTGKNVSEFVRIMNFCLFSESKGLKQYFMYYTWAP